MSKETYYGKRNLLLVEDVSELDIIVKRGLL